MRSCRRCWRRSGIGKGGLLGLMEGLGFRLRAEASLTTLTADVIKSSAIEGALAGCRAGALFNCAAAGS